MITPPTDCFYAIQLHGEAAEVVAEALSAATVVDIREAILISEDFSSDIQATNGMDSTIAMVRCRLHDQDLTELIDLNPLYIPSTASQLDAVIDGEARSDNYHFIGMDGDPFTMKIIHISAGDDPVVMGKVACKPFELPSYTQIIAQIGEKLN